MGKRKTGFKTLSKRVVSSRTDNRKLPSICVHLWRSNWLTDCFLQWKPTDCLSFVVAFKQDRMVFVSYVQPKLYLYSKTNQIGFKTMVVLLQTEARRPLLLFRRTRRLRVIAYNTFFRRMLKRVSNPQTKESTYSTRKVGPGIAVANSIQRYTVATEAHNQHWCCNTVATPTVATLALQHH